MVISARLRITADYDGAFKKTQCGLYLYKDEEK